MVKRESEKRCSIEGCTKGHYAKGFCVNHYHKNRLERLKEETSPTVAVKEIAATAEQVITPKKHVSFIGDGGRSVGIVREVDQLGRVVLPIELRRALGIEISDSMEIFIDEETLILQKYERGCLFCGSLYEIEYVKGKRVCRLCLEEF